ncbi:MAG: type II toxin-antitoxin system VapC family toxin [Pseudorhodoplanes sp.]
MVAWLLNEPGKLSVLELNNLLAQHDVVVPTHWPSEIGNALVTNRRRGRISHHDFERIVVQLARFQISPEPPLSMDEFATTIAFSLEHGLTFYDAAYVKLAVDTEATLATLDSDMRNIALQFGVPVVP